MLRLLRRFASFPPHELLGMPLLSPTMTKGTLVRWLKNEGEVVKAGQILFEVETDKAVLGYEVQDDTIIAKILAPDGTADLDIGSPLAVLVEETALVGAFKDYVVEAKTKAEAMPADKPAQAPPPQAVAKAEVAQPEVDVKMWPSARLILEQNQISPASVKHSGTVITKQDALAAVKDKLEPHATSLDKKISFPQVPRAEPAKTPSYQIVPRFSVTTDLNLEPALQLAALINKSLKTPIALNDLLIKSAAVACTDVPTVNSSWLDTATRIYDDVHVKYVTESGTKLTTAYLPAANLKRLSQIGQFRASVSDVSQFCSFEIVDLTSSAVVKHTQSASSEYACVLTLGKVQAGVVPDAGSIRSVQISRVSLNCDHRIVDGAVGAQWLDRFKYYVENPALLL